MAPVCRWSFVSTAVALAFSTAPAARVQEAHKQMRSGSEALLETSAKEQGTFPFAKLGALTAPLVGRGGVVERQHQGRLHQYLGPSDPMWIPAFLWEPAFVKGRDDDQEYNLMLPKRWADHLQLDKGIDLIRATWHTPQYKSSVYQATSKGSSRPDVVVKIADSDDQQSIRQTEIWHEISHLASQGSIDTWGIMPVYETSRDMRHTVYLMPKADRDLREHLMDRRIELMMKLREEGKQSSGQGEEKTPQSELIVPLPLEEALIMTIDLLHGVKSLFKAGIIDGDLCPGNILVKDGRAFITDFGHSAKMYPNDEEVMFSHAGMQSLVAAEQRTGDFIGSAYRQAPEMARGVPFGAKSSVWGVGLLLAEMVLGYCPTTVKDSPSEIMDKDYDVKGRDAIRQSIREEFSISDAKGFSELPEQLQEILKHMLKRFPSERCDMDAAQRELEAFAKSQGVELPGMFEWPDLGKQWNVEFEP